MPRRFVFQVVALVILGFGWLSEDHTMLLLTGGGALALMLPFYWFKETRVMGNTPERYASQSKVFGDAVPSGDGTEEWEQESLDKSKRVQVNIKHELHAQLSEWSRITDKKVTALLNEGMDIYLALESDVSNGKLLPSRTAFSLNRLAIDLGCSKGWLIRISAAIGTRIFEEDGIVEDTLFDDLYAISQKHKDTSVIDLIAEYVRAGIEAELGED